MTARRRLAPRRDSKTSAETRPAGARLHLPGQLFVVTARSRASHVLLRWVRFATPRRAPTARKRASEQVGSGEPKFPPGTLRRSDAEAKNPLLIAVDEEVTSGLPHAPRRLQLDHDGLGAADVAPGECPEGFSRRVKLAFAPGTTTASSGAP